MLRKIKIKFFLFLMLCLIAVVALSVGLFFAYVSDDRWSAFGTIGTWFTGVFAGVIAFMQIYEIKDRQKKLNIRCVDSVHIRIAIIADALIQSILRVKDISLEKTNKYELEIPHDYLNQIKWSVESMKDLELDSIEKEYLPHEWDVRARALNFELRSVRQWLSDYASKDNFLECNKGDRVISFTHEVENVLDQMFLINPEARFIDSIRGNVKYIRAEIRKKYPFVLVD